MALLPQMALPDFIAAIQDAKITAPYAVSMECAPADRSAVLAALYNNGFPFVITGAMQVVVTVLKAYESKLSSLPAGCSYSLIETQKLALLGQTGCVIPVGKEVHLPLLDVGIAAIEVKDGRPSEVLVFRQGSEDLFNFIAVLSSDWDNPANFRPVFNMLRLRAGDQMWSTKLRQVFWVLFV